MSNGDRDNVAPVSSAEGHARGGDDGGGGNFGERLARIEELIKHLATSEDLQKVRGELGIIKWMLGIVVFILISASVKYFFSL